MIRTVATFLATMALVGCGNGSVSDPEPETLAEATALANLVPFPAQLERRDGELVFGRALNVVEDSGAPDSAAALHRLMDGLGVQQDPDAQTSVQLILGGDSAQGGEGYHLSIGNDVVIRAQTDRGLFYGVQTLRQLLPADAQSEYLLPRLEINDRPQYEWRGSMIDVARTFFELDYLKAHVERMALFKLNKLHLHLTDDQGWRLEIKSWPRLAEVGGSTQVDGGEGGYYTQDEMRELVAFAARHQIEIIPEIDLPGHTQAAIAAYNELACDDVVESPPQNQCDDVVGQARLELYEGTCVGFSALCASEKPDLVYGFVEDVLREVADIFPSRYLHIGGDEVLNEEADAFPAFITRTDAIVESLGRELLAWEEASVGGIRSSSLLQFWNDDYDIEPALQQGIHLVLSPCSYTYFDHGNYEGQPGVYTWCRAQGIPLERVYSLVPEDYRQAVGVEAPMWSEAVADAAEADNRNWPRLSAIAEIAWTPRESRDYQAFTRRLSALQPHFDALKIDYYPAPELGWD